MNITDRLRLELFLREQIQRHGDDLYTELAKILEKIQTEQEETRGRPNLVANKK